jgi:hypothetical protein
MIRLCLLVVLLVCHIPALAQDVTSYAVRLVVENETLNFESESNCALVPQKGDICVLGEQPAEIVFTLGGETAAWEISGLQVRDPAANWGDSLPDTVREDFYQFDAKGMLDVASGEENLVIRNANRHAIAVQYGITVRNRETGLELRPAFAVIDNDGKAGASGN